MAAQLAPRILERVPPVSFAFAYGSGVKKQLGYENPQKKPPMIDLVFAVDQPVEWHKANLVKNRSHYSFLKQVGGRGISWVQDLGPSIYFNPFVKLLPGMEFKYGVISTSKLSEDLHNWSSLYVAGRMQKPIEILHKHEEIEKANIKNLQSAIRLALLLLPSEFTEELLYLTICGISYNGDIRMGIGENQNKVANIVRGNFQEFHELYFPLLKQFPHLRILSNGVIQQDITQDSIFNLFHAMPPSLRGVSSKYFQEQENQRKKHKIRLSDQQLQSEIQISLQKGLKQINQMASLVQTTKGFFSAGLWRSSVYLANKILKRIGGR
eukprot:TRINITY_DN6097_c0_g1_i1.p1 TRINITY_DN6097_c0_g1~~TRINITY_DN6097_c0_g1_i1.p1  ORF type:complete len:324 (-),score=40.56 TRINITY_DN6097_c0_g1_i1:55-1026(-)